MRAEELMAETDLTLAEVARRCGFSAASHFSKVYRERCGQTPSKARERLRRRSRHVVARQLEGVAPALTMQALGMSHFPAEEH